MHRLTLLVLFASAAACSTYRSTPSPTNTREVSAQSDDIAAIRAERNRSNAAIARRDVEAFAASMGPTYQSLPAGAAGLFSRDSSRASLVRQFADTNRLGYVRTPVTIEISTTGPTAAEYGRWVGRRRRDDGIEETSGTYFAAWRKGTDGWRLQTEAFVALACSGSAQCPVRR